MELVKFLMCLCLLLLKVKSQTVEPVTSDVPSGSDNPVDDNTPTSYDLYYNTGCNYVVKSLSTGTSYSDTLTPPDTCIATKSGKTKTSQKYTCDNDYFVTLTTYYNSDCSGEEQTSTRYDNGKTDSSYTYWVWCGGEDCGLLWRRYTVPGCNYVVESNFADNQDYYNSNYNYSDFAYVTGLCRVALGVGYNYNCTDSSFTLQMFNDDTCDSVKSTTVLNEGCNNGTTSGKTVNYYDHIKECQYNSEALYETTTFDTSTTTTSSGGSTTTGSGTITTTKSSGATTTKGTTKGNSGNQLSIIISLIIVMINGLLFL